MAATTRTVTDKIYKPDGTPWAGARVTWRVLDFPALDTDGTVDDAIVTYTADEDGEIVATPTVPASGARRYEVKRPVDGNRPAAVYIIRLGAGAAIEWRDLVAAAELTTTEDVLAGALAAYTKRANNLSDLASAATARTNLGLGTAATAATGDFEAAGAVAAHTGDSSAAHAASAISVTPAGELTSTDVQAALEEIQGDIDGMGGGDVGDLTTTTGSSTNMLRVAAAGGLEYRTTAQVLGDIGAAPTASPTFTGTVTAPTIVGSVVHPPEDGTAAWKLTKADGVTAVLTADTTNSVIAIGGTTESDVPLKVYRNSYDAGIKIENNGYTTDAFRITSGGTTVFSIRYIGSIEFPLGSNLAPAMTFTGDNNTGVYSPGADTISITTGGTEKIRVSSGGLTAMGMSKTTPTAFVDVAAATAAAASLRIRSGTAPTTPNAGDIWFDGTNLKMYDGTTTRTISWT